MNLRGLALVLGLYILLPAVQTAVYLAGLPFADPLDLAAFAASITAYHWMLANVLMGLKVPVFQTALPYDLRIRLHIWTTLGLVAFLALHAVYTIFLKAMEIDAVSWSLLGLFAGLLFLSALWVPLPGLKLRLLKAYDALKAGHKALFFLLAALTGVHLLQSHLLALVPAPSAWGYILLFAAAAGMFLWTRVQNRFLPALEVRSVETSGGIVRLDLGPHPRLRYRAGQFAFLRFSRPGLRGEEHPFSFTTAPHEDRVGFAVRARGDFTAKLGDLRPGDLVRVNSGFGNFRPRPGTEPLALIGSGIGAVPLVSLLKEIGRREPDREVVCLLAVTRRDELVETAALEALPALMPNLKLKLFVSEEDGVRYGPGVLAQELGDPGRYRYYLCSSDKVRTVVAAALESLGVPARKVHFEAFNLG